MLELKIGSVYQSKREPKTTRRITRFAHGNVWYVLLKAGKPVAANCGLTEEMFRDFTSHEISPEAFKCGHNLISCA